MKPYKRGGGGEGFRARTCSAAKQALCRYCSPFGRSRRQSVQWHLYTADGCPLTDSLFLPHAQDAGTAMAAELATIVQLFRDRRPQRG